MKKFNVGIVGYGWAATAHIQAINAGPLGQVTRICSSRQLDARAPSNHAAMGLQSQRILEVCYKSARTGNIIHINRINSKRP